MELGLNRSGIPELWGTNVQAVTAEGENYMLAQQVTFEWKLLLSHSTLLRTPHAVSV